MQKSLGFAVVLAALLLGRPCVAEQQQGSAHAAQHKSGQAQRPVPPTHVVINPPLTAPVGSPPSSTKAEETQEKPLPRFVRPEWVIVYVTIAYALIAWWTLRAISKQADTMEKQSVDSAKFAADTLEEMRAQRLQTANAMGKQSYEINQQTGAVYASSRAAEKSAQAALLNAQAVINAERPWIYAYVRPNKTHRGGFKVSIKNRGRTPAMVVDCRMDYMTAKSLDFLPPEAKYGWDTVIENKIVFPDSVALVMWFDRATVERALGKVSLSFLDEENIFVCGRIRYRDLLNPDPGLIHETRWICGYQFTETGDEVQPIEGFGISGEYERYT